MKVREVSALLLSLSGSQGKQLRIVTSRDVIIFKPEMVKIAPRLCKDEEGFVTFKETEDIIDDKTDRPVIDLRDFGC